MLSDDLKTQIINTAAPLIKQFEEFRAAPYLCPAGVWTIGYGTTRYPNGWRVAKKDPDISESTAVSYLRNDMSRFLSRLEKLWTRVPSVKQGAAMLSLTYNIGIGIRDGKKGDFADSDLLAAFNAGDDARAEAEFLLWDKAHVNGKLVVLSGLKRRREVERKLYHE